MGSILILLLLGQQQVVHQSYDVNGQLGGVRVTSFEGSSRTTVRNVNGREVPIESVDERVISDGVVERTIRRYDPNGNPGPSERMRIETQKNPDGSTEVRTTVSRADLNGNLAPVERRSTVIRKSGGSAETVETVERPALSGVFQIAERSETAVSTAGPDQTTSTTVVRRPDANGRLFEAGRSVTERSGTTENRADFESTGSGMQLVRQTVTRVDGNRAESDVFLPDLQGKPQLSRRQITETSTSAGGATSAVSVQITDGSGRLMPARVVEETTCTGKCQPSSSAIMK